LFLDDTPNGETRKNPDQLHCPFNAEIRGRMNRLPLRSFSTSHVFFFDIREKK